MNDGVTRRVPRSPDDSALVVLGGRYAAERELARGGMATVYLGRDTLLDRPVAIKVLDPGPEQEPRDAFLREARAVAALKHPHIVGVYDAGIEGDLRYIVMEYVPGETLRDLVAREAPLDPVRAARLAATLAEALEGAHQRGVVHCDIKPGNVLLPSETTPKVVDFGIAHASDMTTTLGDTVTGTAGYISPEQVEGHTPDGRADVYSLAAVLYEMLTGSPPFEGHNLAAVAAQRLTHLPADPRERNPRVPDELATIVMRGLARDRRDRFPSAAEFESALRGFTEGQTQHLTRRIVVGQPAASTESLTRRVPAGAAPRVRTPAGVAPPVAVKRGGVPWLLLAPLVAVVAGGLMAAVLLATGVIGSGTTTATVPDVTNQRLDAAADGIHDARLNVASPVEFRQAAQPFGTVIEQNPRPGDVLKRKSDVRLTVSLGP